MDSLTAGREREEIPFSFAAYVLRTCKVWYRMARIRSPHLLAALPKLNINFTGCAIDNFTAACYNGITRKGKEGKHDVVGRKQRKSSIGTRISLSRAATKAIHTASIATMRAIITLGKTIS